MAKYNKIQVLDAMMSTGIVPVFYNADLEVSKNVLKACYEGGIRAFEFANRGDFAHEVFGELVKYANSELPGMILGIGSVVDPGTASLYLQLGANFVVGPLFNYSSKNVYGLRASLLANISRGTAYGIDLGGFGYHNKFYGADVEFLGSMADDLNGVAVAGLFNMALERSYGCVAAIGVNLSKVAYGCQIAGVFNMTDELHGCQVGLVNYARECPWGFQIGLVNLIMDNKIKVLPIVNGYF